jgi:hypothetical protein
MPLSMDTELNELSREERLKWRAYEGENIVVSVIATLRSVGSKCLTVDFRAWDETYHTVELDPNLIQEVDLA